MRCSLMSATFIGSSAGDARKNPKGDKIVCNSCRRQRGACRNAARRAWPVRRNRGHGCAVSLVPV
jgi:hypothetical protein